MNFTTPRMIAVGYALCVTLFFSGCTEPPADIQPIVPIVPAVQDPATRPDSNKVAVCMGLTSVDPKAYSGWKGDCLGCDVDAKGMYDLCRKNNFTSTLMLNEQVTWKNVQETILSQTKNLKRGDLLLVLMSGHGGQLPDDNGDESDKLDETICLWDGQVRDDEVLKLIQQLPAGLRVVLINDQCHSEGNFRSFMRAVQRAVTFGSYGKHTGKALIQPKDLPDIQLLQFAGCREADYSYGSETGGTWTQSLLSTFIFNLSWVEWFEMAKQAMPAEQIPVLTTFGNVTAEFKNGRVME